MTDSGLGRPRSAPRVAIDSPDQLAEVAEVHRPLFERALDRACRDFHLDRADAEDALQNAIVTALRRFEAVRGDIVLYLLWRFRRNCRRLSQHESLTVTAGDLSTTEHEADPTEVVSTRAHLQETYTGLSATDRTLLAYEVLGYQGPEIARMIGKTPGTTLRALSRARERARRLWENGGATPATALLAADNLAFPHPHALSTGRSTWWKWARTCARRRLGPLLEDHLSVARWAIEGWNGLPAIVALGVAAATVVATAAPAPPRHFDHPSLGRSSVDSRSTGVLEAHRTIIAGASPAPVISSGPTPPARGAATVDAMLQMATSRTGASERPGDTQLTDAAPAADYATSKRIVAVGFGRSCQCTVLYQTTDGGQTWAARDAVPGAEQVVLPPDPDDPRIFLGTAPGGSAPPYVVGSFNGLPMPLPAPAGHITLSADFDHGDDRAFVAATGALWSVELRSEKVAIVLTYPGAAKVAQTTSASAASGDAIYVAVPPAPAAALTGASTPGIYACPIDGQTCQFRSKAMPDGITTLARASGSGGLGVLVAVSGGRVWTSDDDGRTFDAAPLSPGATLVGRISVANNEIWGLLTEVGNSGHRVAMLDVATNQWKDVTGGHPLLAAEGLVVVALHPGIALDLLGDGFLCTADGGNTWSARCIVGS